MSRRRSLEINNAVGVPTEDDVRAHLKLIVASSDFPSSLRNRRFFEFVVERSLRGEKTNGYQVATQVFGRPASFNATTDPIVRIEASKLRRDLETYYLKSGRHDRVRIDLPKGTYRALFSFRDELFSSDGKEIPAASLVLLRTSLLGWCGDMAEAHVSWGELRGEFPDLLLDPRAHTALEKIHGRDDRVRELLLEGLRRASRPAELRPQEAMALV